MLQTGREETGDRRFSLEEEKKQDCQEEWDSSQKWSVCTIAKVSVASATDQLESNGRFCLTIIGHFVPFLETIAAPLFHLIIRIILNNRFASQFALITVHSVMLEIVLGALIGAVVSVIG